MEPRILSVFCAHKWGMDPKAWQRRRAGKAQREAQSSKGTKRQLLMPFVQHIKKRLWQVDETLEASWHK
jgi:hypothetical protein